MLCNCLLILVLCANFVFSDVIPAPKLKLRDGREIPSLALGTWLGNNTKGRIEPHSTEVKDAVSAAIDLGYRHIDTAYAYKVEDQVGRAVNKKIAEGVKREDLFITTKLWNDRHARDAVVPALRESLDQLKLDYVDLYLIHWPVGQFALGLARSVGVSNFNQQQIERLVAAGLELPAVLQVEINLNLQQPSLLAYCRNHHIVVMGYTPFGSLFPSKAREDAPPPRVDDPALVGMGEKYNKTVTQITLRYLLDLGIIPIPKALKPAHLAQNFAVFDFSLSQEDRDWLKTYDKGYRTIPQLKWLDHPYYPFEKS